VDRTSCTYCLMSQGGIRSGAARSSSVAWQAYTSSPVSGSEALRVVRASTGRLHPGWLGRGGAAPLPLAAAPAAGTRRSHASFQ
jgi:hypothetical protein